MFFSRLLLASLILGFALAATLPNDEVEGLRGIGKILGKKNWNFSVDPCSGMYGWADRIQVAGAENYVTCNCSFSNGTICHVVSIVLKGQNLQGTLPTDLSSLPFLGIFDLSRNFLNSTIPPQWGSTQLTNISLLGNRLTGPIPREFGNISTLLDLVVEYNHLGGELPPELGNLGSIRRLLFTSNNFTMEIPATFAKLTTLQDFRIGDNKFTGQIPNLIQNWTNLGKLVIQGSGLSGPIPSGISLLANMTDLRISDLSNGTETSVPVLSTMKDLKTLILRSCNIVGKLPDDYLAGMTKLKTLDLSFNKLTGQIPSSFLGLAKAEFIYLTGNQFTGTVPEWNLQKAIKVDLSYNNFTTQSSCQQRSVNLFGSSLKENVSTSVSCLRSYHCPKDFYSFHINCGGKEATVGGIRYEDDTDSGGASNFYQSRTNWAFSSTGNFMDDDRDRDSYTWENTSTLSNVTSALYLDARLSPITLTYYGFCMGNGNYTVSLHFAEIMFTDDNTYSSLGRRMFDIYIQEELVWKDFNIADIAGGAGKAVIKNFTAIVTNQSLQIRFYWDGKGTTGIPVRGVYGPLISAVSVNPDFTPPLDPSENGSNTTGIVSGIVVSIVGIVVVILGVLWWKGFLGRKDTIDQALKGLDLQTGSFTLKQIKAATNSFSPDNKIGEGGFGSVFKGLLSDGAIIAVKQLSSKSKQGNREFVNEIGMISALQHPHLVKLYGCCIEGNQLLLVYEYMENNSLARALFGPEEYQLKLDWPTRHNICVGIARGLAFLHEESRLKIVHRDIKATNVLLDANLNPKISDFGLAKLDEEENTHISTRVAGTYGYMAPEYAMRGHLTDKADVYSFGIVALEIICGRSNTSYRLNIKEGSVYLLDWALVLKEEGNLLELVDPRMGTYDTEQMMTVINVALQCASVSPAVRPAMSSVVSMLEGKSAVEDLVMESSASSFDEMKIEAMRKHFKHGNDIEHKTGEIQTQSMSMDGPWTGSSTSAQDLYPVTLDSNYWENRN